MTTIIKTITFFKVARTQFRPTLKKVLILSSIKQTKQIIFPKIVNDLLFGKFHGKIIAFTKMPVLFISWAIGIKLDSQ